MINNDYQSGVLRGCNYFQLLPSYGINVRKVISGSRGLFCMSMRDR